MARGRLVSRSLSTSAKRASLHTIAPRGLAEFCQALFDMLIVHSDDIGRLPGDPFTVKHAVEPTSPRRLADFERALEALHQSGLIHWYEVNGRRFIQIENAHKHQAGLNRTTPSAFPEPPGRSAPLSPLNMSETDVEAYFAAELEAGRLQLPPFAVLRTDRQVRVGSSYLDIVATTAEGPKLVIEVKRQRVTAAAIAQVLKYCRLLAPQRTIPVVIGHGVAAGLQTVACGALIAIYDPQLRVTTVSSLGGVIERDLTLFHAQSNFAELKRTELKGIEEKGTEEKEEEEEKAAAAAAPLTLGEGTLEGKVQTLVQAHHYVNPEAHRPSPGLAELLVAEQAAHLPQGLDDPDLADSVKQRCADLRLTYDSALVGSAIESERAKHDKGVPRRRRPSSWTLVGDLVAARRKGA